jgi:hypothetical protein
MPLTVHDEKKPIQPQEKKPVEFNLDRLIKFGVLEKEVEVIAGVKVVLHTLTDIERENAFALVSDTDSKESLLAKMENIKKPILAYAISKINDEVFDTTEKKQVLYEKLKQMQSSIVDLIYFQYQQLVDEQFKLISEGLKKN